MNTTHSNRGSVYLVTLITVAAIASMVLIGVKLRTSTNTHSTLIEQMAESNNAVLDATEYALQTIVADPAWNATAQSGTIFNNFALNNTTYTGTVTDADTAALPTDSTTDYRLKLTTTTNSATSAAQIDLLSSKPDYISTITDLDAEAYWPLNESTGDSTAIDLLSIGDGTYQDPAIAGIATNDEGAKVPLFNSNDHIQVPWSETFKQSNGSITLWMKSTEAHTFVTYGILGMQYKSNDEPNLMLTIFGRTLYAFVSDDGSYASDMLASSSSKVITLDIWHHVALTWGSNGLTIYLDGTQVALNNRNTAGIDTAKASKGGEQPLKIGAANISFFGSNPEVDFKGSLAHVVFYSSQLNAAEVAELAAIKPDLTTIEIVPDSWAKVFE